MKCKLWKMDGRIFKKYVYSRERDNLVVAFYLDQ